MMTETQDRGLTWLVRTRTGYDPTITPVFEWSTTRACWDCDTITETALLSFDGVSFRRLCVHCAVDAE